EGSAGGGEPESKSGASGGFEEVSTAGHAIPPVISFQWSVPSLLDENCELKTENCELKTRKPRPGSEARPGQEKGKRGTFQRGPSNRESEPAAGCRASGSTRSSGFSGKETPRGTAFPARRLRRRARCSERC